MRWLLDLGRRMAVPVLAVVTAFMVGAIVIILTDFDHLAMLTTDPVGAIGGAIDGVAKAYGAMLAGAFGDPGKILKALDGGTPRQIGSAIRPITETLVATTPLIFTGLGVAISFRAGMFNIGGTGQLLLGGLASTMTVLFLGSSLPAPVVLVAGLVAAAFGGALFGFIPGFLKAQTGASEVITTIMLNYVASLILYFALRSDELRQAGSTSPVSKNLNVFVDVPNIITLPSVRLDYSFVVALIMAVLVSWLLFRTTKGFELRASGFSPTAARYAGMSAGQSMMLAMTLSGALAGLAGGFLAIGAVGYLSLDLAGGIGFNAIALALLAGLRPSGIVAAALLFGALTQGGHVMNTESGIPFDLLTFIFSLVIMFVAAPGLIRSIWRIGVRPKTEDVTPVSTPPASTTTAA
jgi:simple sugar transport system permease protein